MSHSLELTANQPGMGTGDWGEAQVSKIGLEFVTGEAKGWGAGSGGRSSVYSSLFSCLCLKFP